MLWPLWGVWILCWERLIGKATYSLCMETPGEGYPTRRFAFMLSLLPLAILFQRRSHSVLGEYRRVHLLGTQPTQRRVHLGACECEGFLHAAPDEQLCSHRASSNGGGAAHGLEFGVRNAVVFDTQIEMHEVPAGRVRDQRLSVCWLDDPDVTWVLEMLLD